MKIMKDDVAKLKPKLPTLACRDNEIKMNVLMRPPKHFQFSYQAPIVEQDFKVSGTIAYSALQNFGNCKFHYSGVALTRLSPMFHFCNPLYPQKRFSKGFLTFSEGTEMEYWTKLG